jgi:hypothetical protein
MNDAHLESVAIESEVAVDPAQEALDRRVAANGPASTARASRARQSGVKTSLVGPLEESFDALPLGSLKLLQHLGLGHCRFSEARGSDPTSLSTFARGQVIGRAASGRPAVGK